MTNHNELKSIIDDRLIYFDKELKDKLIDENFKTFVTRYIDNHIQKVLDTLVKQSISDYIKDSGERIQERIVKKLLELLVIEDLDEIIADSLRSAVYRFVTLED